MRVGSGIRSSDCGLPPCPAGSETLCSHKLYRSWNIWFHKKYLRDLLSPLLCVNSMCRLKTLCANAA